MDILSFVSLILQLSTVLAFVLAHKVHR